MPPKIDARFGDSRELLRELPDGSIDACVTDPPYGLGFMGKKWDDPGALVERRPETANAWDHVGGNHNPANSKDAARTRLVEGRKFQAWATEWASEVYRVLKPGGFLVAFGATRTYHRLACGIEDAGFEVRDMVAWLYGSGFPKSHDVSKGIDKAAGAERRVVSERKTGWSGTLGGKAAMAGLSAPDVRRVTEAATADAAAWEGWGTALKPALEPVVLARKPLGGTVAANVLAHGTGALNIDGCRIEVDPKQDAHQLRSLSQSARDGSDGWGMNKGAAAKTACVRADGRWPANVCHDGSDEVMAGFPDADGAVSNGRRGKRGLYEDGLREQSQVPSFGDTGSAARFFYTAKADAEDRLGSKHPTVKPVDLMRWLCRLVTPPGGVILDPFAGTGTTGLAAQAEGFASILMERDPDYFAMIERRIAWARGEAAKTTGQMIAERKKQEPLGGLFEGIE